jgi:hypothetical protein
LIYIFAFCFFSLLVAASGGGVVVARTYFKKYVCGTAPSTSTEKVTFELRHAAMKIIDVIDRS